MKSTEAQGRKYLSCFLLLQDSFLEATLFFLVNTRILKKSPSLHTVIAGGYSHQQWGFQVDKITWYQEDYLVITKNSSDLNTPVAVLLLFILIPTNQVYACGGRPCSELTKFNTVLDIFPFLYLSPCLGFSATTFVESYSSRRIYIKQNKPTKTLHQKLVQTTLGDSVTLSWTTRMWSSLHSTITDRKAGSLVCKAALLEIS